MTRQEIQQFLPQGATFAQFGALNYAVMDENWLLETCWPAFWQWLRDQGIEQWTVPYECRDFASDFRMFCVRASAQAGNRPNGEDGAAIGEIWFRPDASRGAPFDGLEGHAINVYPAGGILKGVDPQNGKVWLFSETELRSAVNYPTPCLKW